MSGEVYKLELDATEIKTLIADLAAIARGGAAPALLEGIQGECLEMSCGDPVEAEIASAVAGGMADSGVNQWEAENIGRNVAAAIKAYRREMAQPDERVDE